MTVTIISASSTSTRLRRSGQRFRSCIIATLALLAASIIASAPVVSASPSRKCIEIKDDYDLRNAARDSNVFLVVHELEDKEARENICNKLEGTPQQRLVEASEKGKETVFAYLVLEEDVEDSDGQMQEGNQNFVKTTLGVKKFPSFLFLSKGMDRNSKFSSHITQYKGSDSLDLSDVVTFIEKKVGFRIGNDVYNVIFFDSIASRFVSYGDATGLDRIKQRGLALLVRFSTLFSFKEPLSSIGKLYNRAFAMSFEHGMDYSEKQVEKLQSRLEKNKNSLSQDKVHEFQQKIAILKAFAEPKELTPEDDKNIFIHCFLHLGLLIGTILLFIVPSDETDEVKKGEEIINAEPLVSKSVDEDDKSD